MNSKYFVSYEALKARFPSFQYFICKRSVRTVHDAIEWIIDLFIMPSCVLFFLVCDLCSRFKLLFFFFWVLMWEKQQLSIHGRCTMHHHLLSSKLLHKTKRNAGGREARRNQKLNKFSAASFVCTPRLTLGSFRCRYIVNIIICNITSIIRVLFCLQNSFILLLGLQVGEILEVPFVQNLILKSFICSVFLKPS